MKSYQIDYFLTLAKYKSYSRTATHFYIAQSALSKNIRSLEEEMGFKLFKREKNSIVLTEQGQVMARYFAQAKIEYHQALEEARTVSVIRSGRNLKLGVLASLSVDFIMDQLSSLYPALDCINNIQITIIPSVGAIPSMLAQGDVDLAFTLLGPANIGNIGDEDIRFIDICHTYNQLYFRTDHPAASLGRRPVPSDFEKETIYVVRDDSLTGTMSSEASTPAYLEKVLGFYPNIKFTNSPASAIANMNLCQGVAILFNCTETGSYDLDHIDILSASAPTLVLVYSTQNDAPTLRDIVNSLRPVEDV